MFYSEPEFFHPADAEEIVLRPYQEESIEALRKNKRDGKHSQVLASMVGSGKTVMAAHLLSECWKKGRRGIFVADRTNLINQTSAMFDYYGIIHGVIQSQHPRWKPGELIQVASIQTLARRNWPVADLIINDECHVSYRAMLAKIARRDAHVIGLSATPFTKGMGKHYEALVNVTTGNKLTADGFLVPFKVWAANEPDMSGATSKDLVAGEWSDAFASKRAMPIVGSAVEEYQKHGNGKKALVFGVDVPHCEELQRQALSAGIKAELYTYHTQDEARDCMMKEFRKPDSEIRWLISVAALARGTDIPDIGVLIMCRPLKNSFAEFVQILGRLLRPFLGKTHGIVLDLAGNFLRHYPRLVEFMEEGVNELDDGKPKPKSEPKKYEKKPIKCPNCSYLPCGSSCPSCGYIFPPRSTVIHAEGALSAFDGSQVVKYDKAAKTRLYGELAYIAHMGGANGPYKTGWISHKYRAITGVWPTGVKTLPIPPSAVTLEIVRRLNFRGTPKKKPHFRETQRREVDLFG